MLRGKSCYKYETRWDQSPCRARTGHRSDPLAVGVQGEGGGAGGGRGPPWMGQGTGLEVVLGGCAGGGGAMGCFEVL